MTLTNQPLTATGADARQAALFRDDLLARRHRLDQRIAHVRAMIDRRTDSGRLRAIVHGSEAEVRQLDQMITHLHRRYGAHWTADIAPLPAESRF